MRWCRSRLLPSKKATYIQPQLQSKPPCCSFRLFGPLFFPFRGRLALGLGRGAQAETLFSFRNMHCSVWADIKVLGEQAGLFQPRCLAGLSSQLAVLPAHRKVSCGICGWGFVLVCTAWSLMLDSFSWQSCVKFVLSFVISYGTPLSLSLSLSLSLPVYISKT